METKEYQRDLHISKIVRNLQKSSHLCFIHEVVDRVQEHVSCSGASREKRNPLPIIVFGVQDKVDRHNSRTNGNHGQNQINE